MAFLLSFRNSLCWGQMCGAQTLELVGRGQSETQQGGPAAPDQLWTGTRARLGPSRTAPWDPKDPQSWVQSARRQENHPWGRGQPGAGWGRGGEGRLQLGPPALPLGADGLPWASGRASEHSFSGAAAAVRKPSACPRNLRAHTRKRKSHFSAIYYEQTCKNLYHLISFI